MNILVMGAGALGSFLGACLSDCHKVTLVGLGEHAEAVKERGLKISGRTLDIQMDNTIPPGQWDLIILSTKAYDAEKALMVLKGKGPVVIFSNGIGLEELAFDVLGKDTKIYRGLTSHGFRIEEPGSVEHTGLGRTQIDGPDWLVSDLTKAGFETILIEDMAREVWIKGVVNACINPVGAIANKRNGLLLEDPLLLDTMKRLCDECGAVAREVVDLEGFNLWERVHEVASMTSGNRCSMLQDLDMSRLTEIDWINGAFIRKAAELGIDVPTNMAIIAMVKAKATYLKITTANQA